MGRKAEICPRCRGTGEVPSHQEYQYMERCSECRGAGFLDRDWEFTPLRRDDVGRKWR